MNTKIRLALSVGVALIAVVLTYLTTENASEHRNIVTILTVPGIVFFLATLVLTSIFNTQNETTRKRHLVILAIVMIANTFIQYNANQKSASVLDKASDNSFLGALALAYLATAGVAFIFRFFTYIKERYFNTLPS